MKKIYGHISLLILAVIMSLLVGCGGSTDKNEEVDSQLHEETEVQEPNIAASNFLNGVSKDYDMSCTRMVSPEQVIADFNNEGYQYVYLESHESELGDGNGYAGTTDTITLTCTYVDENGLWYVMEGITAIYSYWGDNNGASWIKNTGLGEILESSFEGFNGTYWSILASNRNLVDLARPIFDYELNILDYDDFKRDFDYYNYVDDLNIGLYLYLDNFEGYYAALGTMVNYKDFGLECSSNSVTPTIKVTLVLEGEIYEKTITPVQISYSESYKRMYFSLISQTSGVGINYDSSKTTNSKAGSSGCYMIYLTEDEYTTDLQKRIDLGATASESAKKSEGGTYNNYIEKLYSDILDGINTREEYGSYFLYDIDNNGIYELFVGHGTNSADYKYEVYTAEQIVEPLYDEKNQIMVTHIPKEIGDIYSEQTFYVAPDGDGIYAVYGNMGHEVISRLSFETIAYSISLIEEVVSDRDIDFANGETYYSNNMPIEESDFEDRDLLKKMTALMATGNGSDDNVGETVNGATDNNPGNDDFNNKANDDYILAESNTRYYSAEELSGLSKDDLRIARNEIYARHGRIFDSADLDEYFRSKSWYNPTTTASQFDESVLNDYEKKNADMIKSVENGN